VPLVELTSAFVTGGSGFVGRHLIAMLVERGVEVAALARSDASARRVRDAGATAVAGDLADAEALATGCRGREVVFHAAAKVDQWGHRRDFVEVNVEGTRRLLEAARESGVTRFVHVSTEAVLVGGPPIVGVDETRRKPARPVGLYAATKAEAEDLVLAANAASFETVVARPRLIWGEGDTSLLPKLMEAVEAGRFRWISKGRYLTSTCHVKNVCHGLLLAAEKGAGGEVYFLTDGDAQPFREFVSRLLATQGVEPPDKALPRWLARTVAWTSETIWRVLPLRGAPPITRTALKLIGEEVTVDDAKARRELGYEPIISVEEGLREMAGDPDADPATTSETPSPGPDES
jgi:nucleoside-diphosphate-sugar epimerase